MIKRRRFRRTPARRSLLGNAFRQLRHEVLERRELLAAEVLAIRPDSAGLLQDGDVLNVAPRELNLFFNGGANLDETTINASTVRLIRSGGDGSFDGNDIQVALGYVGLVNPGSSDPGDLQQVVIRPASTAAHNATDPAVGLPDDLYQIQIIGAGSAPLADLGGRPFSDGDNAVINFRLDRGAQVVAVVPQPVTRSASGDLVQADNQIVVYFDDQTLNRTDAENPAFFRLVDTQAALTADDDRTLLPQTAQYDVATNRVTLTFDAAIPEGTYRLDIGRSDGGIATATAALRVGTLFNQNAFRHNGYLGDQGDSHQDPSDRDFYRLELAAGSQLNLVVTPHRQPLNLRARLLDSGGSEVATVVSGAGTAGTLNFTVPTDGHYFVEVSSADTSDPQSTGSYGIVAQVSGHAVSNSDANSTFTTATPLGSLGAAGLTLAGQIQPQNIPLPPRHGGSDEPGHREIQRETHIGASGTNPSLPAPVVRVNYHFPPAFANPSAPGESFLNQITAEERRIVRSIFEIFASHSGYEFVETPNTGLRIGKTDLRAFNPDIGPNAGVGGLGGGGGAIVNAALYQDANRYFGDGFTGVMFHEIGHALGLSHAYDLSALMGEGTPNDVVPGDHDIVHLQRISPPNSTDIDLYRFELAEAGRFSAETIAERLSTPSLLNTVLSLYRQTASGDRELVARNDRYFGTDSFIELDLQPGTYFIGVSSTGNDQYDPNVPDSGYDGTTDGPYELRLRFDADRGAVLRDADGTAMDGDGDGVPGGVHQFWFQASDVDSTIFVDRANDPLLGGSGGDGSLAAPFDRLNAALAAAGSRIVVPRAAAQAIQSGESFVVDDGTTELRFSLGAGAGQPIDLAGLTTAEQIAGAIAAAINASSLSATATVQGRVVRLTGIDNLDVSDSPALLHAPNLVRIVGNAGADGDVATAADNLPYLLGSDSSGNPLRDGNEFLVPQGVTVMLEAGALIKARRANLDAGTSAVNLSRAAAAIQVLGTPLAPVWMRSYHDDTIGGNSDGVGPGPQRGDFGGIVFRGDSDLESAGVFLNHVTHLDIQHGGGQVFVNSSELVFAPIHLEDARPTVRFNHIARNADSAISANPDSFDDSLGRIGPQIVGNFLNENTIDGLFIRIRTQQGAALDKLNLPGRFDDTDITHVLSENLLIAGNPGGPLQTSGGLVARAAGRLMIDPGVVLKINGARIEAERGSSALIAEGTPNRPIIFTSLADDRYGGSGAFDSNANGFSIGSGGDWAGLYFGHVSSGRIDNAVISFGGGDSPIEGGSANFNVIEVHQADLRVTNSLIRDNDSGAAGGVARHGRGANTAAVIYGRGSQPVIVGNTFIDNAGPVLSLDVNSLHHRLRPDGGRATGPIDVHAQFADNHGPLVRLNSLAGNGINGMLIRGGEMTIQGVWDDTDIVHVLRSEVVVGNHHTSSGLRLQSSNSESLVIKLEGASAGFTATGTPLDIVDRIGGTIHVLGRPGFPVVLTHFADDSVGAGFAPDGTPMTNTDNSAAPTAGTPGGWRGLRFDHWSNDRNVAIVRESENPLTSGKDLNRIPAAAQFIGELAPNEKSGDENRRLGFEIHGYISPDDPGDVDVYSFRGTAGTPIWIDVDRTDPTLDAIVEVLNASGTVVARSVRSGELSHAGNLNAADLTQNPLLGGDYFTHNFRDPGMHYVLPGEAGSSGTYFLRVRSNPQSGQVTDLAGKSSGKYQLQLRLQQVDEFPGSTVRFADIRYASTAIDVYGLPSHSPLVGEAGELAERANDSLATAQPLVNLLQTDMAAISISGELSSATDVDWYRFDVKHVGVQEIGGVNDDPGTVAVVFDLDYADGATRGDTTVAVYDGGGRLIWIGRESNIEDDRPLDSSGNVDDLSRGSIGSKDPYIGPIHVRPGGTYHVAVMSNQQLPTALMGAFQADPGPGTETSQANRLVRLEPINTVRRVVEDHIGFVGHTSLNASVQPESGPIIDLTNLDDHVVPFQLEDVVLYVATDNAGSATGDHLYTVNPFRSERYLTRVNEGAEFTSGANDIQDIVIRSDGRMFGYQRLVDATGSVGALVEINPSTDAVTVVGNDNIPGRSPTPNTNGSVFPANFAAMPGGATTRANEFTTSDEVDAFTFHRRTTTGPESAPVPVYDTYLVVRETDIGSGSNSKLYRGRADGNAAPAIAAGGNPAYGFVGDLQPLGVTFASRTLTVSDNATTPNETNIRIESKIPGAAGNNININISRPNNTNATVSVSGTTINLNIGGTGGPPVTGAPTAQAIVDAINNHEVARTLVTAVIISGNAGSGTGNNGTVALNVPGSGSLSGGNNGTGPLQGRVTGVSFGNFLNTGSLYGVTTGGQFISIDPSNGRAMVLSNNPGVNFQGLTLGPQNVQGGAFANTLFATASNGRLYAFDTSGNQLPIFAGGASSIAVGDLVGSAIGVAFSPLDFNLWHPTMKRGGDAGHGVNEAPDATRLPTQHQHNVATPGNAQTRRVNEGQGGVSMHFGFEQWSQNQTNTQSVYLPTSGQNAQHGIRDARQHQDLSSNPNIAGTYNFPGGALGSLQTNSFSLAGSVAQDRPTLYFNYFLQTENHAGSDVTTDVNDPFRDSARVFASRNGGATWELVATNNSRLSGANPTTGTQRAELPGFLSHLSDAALNSNTPRSQSHQIVQELMDNSGQWRQARVDLSSFAGTQQVLLRFDFSTAGAMRDTTLVNIDDSFGEFTSGSTPRSIRSTNNAFEGFYIDDIIVGYAERGEMVTGAPVDSTITNLAVVGQRTRDNVPNPRPNILSGAYQLEIRRTDDVGTWVEGAGTAISQTFHTNDRHLNEMEVISSLGFEVGESFNTALPSVAALREVLGALGINVPAGGLIDSQLPNAFTTWSATGIDPLSGARSLASPTSFPAMPTLIQNALPGSPAQRVAAIYQTTPAQLGAAAGRGLLRFQYSVSSTEDLHGLMLLIDGKPQFLTPPMSSETGYGGANVLASGERHNITVELPFANANSTLTWMYLFADQQGLASGANRAWIDDIAVLQGSGATGYEADRNRHRPQGMFIVESNTITGSAVRGITVQPAQAEAVGSLPHPGSTINFPQLNQDRLVPGVVIQNNIIAGSSAIRFAGELVESPQRPVPFGRIVNNTLVGPGSGVGVQIDGNAGPTLLNNVITRFGTAIAGATGSTIVRSNHFQDNGSNGTSGTDATTAAAGTPLFVDAGARNYYLVSGSAAVDSSLNTLGDRFNYANFKHEIGIPQSPIFAPDRDVFGQLRVDSGQSPGGGGSAVFKDRGAVDRADGDAPFAVLLDPIDNDITGLDQDPNLSVVSLLDPIAGAFSILLTDGPGPNAPFQGTGVDPLSVSRDVVTVRRNNRGLVEGVDYTLGYNTATGEMRLTPLSTLWEPSGVYEIILDNQQITDRAGNPLRPNQPDGTTRFWIVLPSVGFDFGDAPASFATALAADGPRHALIDGALPRLGGYVDAENGLSPVPVDDLAADIFTAVALPAGESVFAVSGDATPAVAIQILSAAPAAGDRITIDTGSGLHTFELVPVGVAAAAGNVAVRFVDGDTPESIAEKLRVSVLARLGSVGEALSVTIDAAAPDTLLLTHHDDEDGVGVTRLLGDNYLVFVRPGDAAHPQYADAISDNGEVLGFLNPLDPAGAQVALTVTGSGFIDGWIDFDGNGVFDPESERVFDSIAVNDGLNILNIATPVGTADGQRWMRIRLSPEGGLQPTGLAVGGEVEDHLVEIINVDLPIPSDDRYALREDTVLDSLTANQAPVVDNDSFATRTFTPFEVVVVERPEFAADFSLDPATGHFVYEPLTDFAGIDTFTYYVAIQQSAVDADITLTQPLIATVTIDVRPVNDAPLAAPQSFVTLESQPVAQPGDPPQVGRGTHPLTISAAELLADARAHANPQYPAGAPAAPWDETDQSLRVVEIVLPDGTVIDAAGAGEAVVFNTVHGTLTARFVTADDPDAPFVSSLGALVDLTYVPHDYLNRDNVTLQSVEYRGQQVNVFDFIRFTIEDDGLLIDPATIDPDTHEIIEDDTFFTTPFNPLDPTNPLGRLRHRAIALLDVAPQNDYPLPADDRITVGAIGAGLPTPAGDITAIDPASAWSEYFIGLGLEVPVPTEDQTLVIPAGFLLKNDFVGQAISTDERGGINDGDLRIIGVTLLTEPASGGGSVSVNDDGDVVFVAPTDVYGEVVFSYVIQDSGIDEDRDGNRPVAPLTATGTVTIVVQPANDAPQAFDRQLAFAEAGEPGVDRFEFAADQLLDRLHVSTPAVPGSLTPELQLPFTEAEQALRVVAFATDQGAVDVAQLDDYTGPGTGNGMLVLPSDDGGYFEFDIVAGALTTARFFAAADYSERTPFAAVERLRFTIEDDGRTTDPQSGAVIELPAVRSTTEATLTITVGESNDAPIFTLPTAGLVIDENGGQTVVQSNFVTVVAPGPLTALDELQRQNVAFSITPVNVPEGLMMVDGNGVPLLPSIDVTTGEPDNWTDAAGNGTGAAALTVYPAADAFGFAVYLVTATDNDPDNPRSTSQLLTITINPVNDVPVAYDRALNVDEAVEVDGEVALIPFDAARLIQGAGETPSVPGLFPIELIDPYNETEQALRVVAFGVPGAADVDVTIDEPGLVAGTGTVTRTTVTGGTLTFQFVNGAFVSGSYAPAIDYNQRTPFDATDLFTYILSDDGQTTLPGSGFVDYNGSSADSTITIPEQRSAAATVTLTVTQQNDPPIFTMPSGFTFDENAGEAVVSIDFVTMLAPSELTALDELQRQDVSFSFAAVSVPAGMMTQLPTIDVDGEAGAWPGTGTLTVYPAADAFGFAVYLVTATDNDPDNPRSTSQLLTITINSVNDVPVAYDRALNVDEAVEVDGEVALIPFDAARLIQGAGETPSVPGLFPIELIDPYNETEQALRVVAFGVPGAADVDATIDEPGLAGGTGTVARTTVTGGTLTFQFVNGAFVSGSYAPAIDYNQRTPFDATDLFTYILSDDGQTTLPGSGFVDYNGSSADSTITIPEQRSAAATVTLTVTQQNDPPIFTMPSGFTFDENAGEAVVSIDFVTMLAPSELTALDELQRQDVSFSFAAVSVPAGMMTQLPTIDVDGEAGDWPGTGTLTVYPAADAFGFAVYLVTATDNDPDNPRSTSQLLTITINPVNDVPVAYDRALNVDEAVEVDGEVALIPFDAARLIQGAGETPSVPGLFPIELIDPYNETEQALRVVAFGVPGAADVDVTIDEPGLVAGTGTVTRTTVTGGTLTFQFVNGAFTSGSYAPAIDYNQRTPFDATDLFTYILSDDGQTTLPGSGFVDYGGSATDSTITIPEQRSAAATVTLTVTQQNDPPIFTMPDGFTFDENAGEAVTSVDFVTMLAPSELTALDELQRQDVSFSFAAVSVPAGMMTQLPTIDVDGEAGAWPGTGTLTVYPAADAFGFAVYLVTATDNDPDNPRSTSQLLTITINPVNDVPVAYDRALNVDEAVEVDGEVAVIPFDAARLIQGAGETPSVPGLFPIELIDPYNETEQALRVVAFGVPGAADVDVTIDEPGLTGGTGTVTRTTVTGGTLTFQFVNGAFVSGSYAPAIDFNQRTPFDATDLFTYILSDDGQTTLPGSGFVDYNGSSADSTITIPEQRSAAATVTLTVTQQNDPPIFTMPGGFTFAENNGQAVVSVDFVTMLAPSELTALDELQRQDVSFSFAAVSVPAGMMTQLPTIDVDGEAGAWPGTGTLTVYPAADAFGFAVYLVTATDNDPDNPRSTSQLLTITINSVNDVPVAYDRELVVAEAVERDGEVAVRNFTREELLGIGAAVPNAAGLFPGDLIAPYNESEQRLRIVRFEIPGQAPIDATIDEPGLVGGTGTVSRITRTNENGVATATSGVLTFEFVDGEFISGSYTPAVDYNERTPFDATDPFTYFIADDGQTTLPGSGYVDYDGTGSGADATIELPGLRSVAATVALRVTQVNDPPRFNFHDVVNVLERDDNQPAVVAGWATNIAPAAATALDELARQSVSFQFVPELSSVPAGLFQSPPVVTPEGTLSVFPMRDAVGTAVIVMRAVDHEPTAGFQSRSTDATFTVNVRPVNDRPAFNPSRFNTSDSVDADTAWQVLANGTIRYTLRENNAQPNGDRSGDFFIPLRQLDILDVYNPIGMLDIFRVGPANEADGTPGGLQTLDLANFPSTTALGGLLTPAIVNGQAGLYYRPPVNANLANSGLDSFSFTATDDGQTYVLGNSSFVDGTLVDAPLTINGRVELRLNPVNNPPEFTLPATHVEAAEDSSLVVHPGFATGITPGPANAPDEASQSVNFIINPLSFTRGGADDPFAAGYPQINSSGRLTFRPLPNVFGSFEFEVIMIDSGPGAADGRGDNNRSLPQTITIDIQPVNDPPAQVANPAPLNYELLEDQSIDLPLAGIPGLVGLLDNFRVGPDNEAADLAPQPGGNQSLWLLNPPTETLQNGRLTPLFDLDGNLTHLRYTPRAHFAGIDTFTFTVSDDGVSVAVGAGGQPHDDPRSTTGTVTLHVLPVNDAPVFSGGGGVQVDEDAGLVTISGWATGLLAGPTGAADELQGLITGLPTITPQSLQFIITRVDNAGSSLFEPLFTIDPTATISGSTATLSFQTAPDANGVAVFEVVLRDDGPNDAARGDLNASAPIRLTITVGAINDPPQFVPGADIQVTENSGPYSQPWASDILPGTPTALDELAEQTVHFQVEHTIVSPVGFTNMFAPGGAPAIDSSGVLSFTPAENAAGEVLVRVTLIDSEGDTSETRLFTILITDTNQPPVAADLTLEGDEDNLLEIPGADLLALATDPDLQTNPLESLSITDVAPLSAAGATISIGPGGELLYDPRGSAILQALAPGELFVDHFTYSVVDASAAHSNLATITINVAGINDAPLVSPDTVLAAPGQSTVISPLENDVDLDGTLDPTSIFITRQPSSGSLTVRPDGSLLYTPLPGFRGTDTIRYTVADNLGQQSEQATITIELNEAPVAVDDIVGTYRGRSIDINVASNDFDPDGALDLDSIEIVTPPGGGTVVVLGGGIIRYLPGDNFIGLDTFQYTIRDDRGQASNVGQVRVQVVDSELQNPSGVTDVNGSGLTTPLDALLILNRLARAAREGMVGSIPVELLLDETPRYFYDVSGNRRVEPLDALLVINEIARQNRERVNGEGELAIPAAPPIVAASFVATTAAETAEPKRLDDPGMDLQQAAKSATFDWDDDEAYRLLASDIVQTRSEKDRKSSDEQFVDAIWSEF